MGERNWSVVLLDGSGNALEIIARNEWLSSAAAFATGFGVVSSGRIPVVMNDDAAELLMKGER